ncbi:peptidoglycan-binding domain-containing protein [Streptomyces coelicoflavus]|uniref:peptidoglycan-binding domain-containing protein n=1 Tax=Streptomyces coelicoflavus TaxID=285562 RepID=UPI00364570F3
MEQEKEPSQEPPGRASCPECGTPRAADNTPSCACGTRASDALRDARTAQAAAAEDFDPLRIRPYVELDGAAEPSGTPESSGASGASGERPDGPVSDPDATMTLRAVGAGAGAGAGADGGAGAGAGAGSRDGGTKAAPALPTPLAPSAGSPSAHDLRLFEASTTAPLPRVSQPGPGTGDASGGGGRPSRGRRKGLLLSAAGAVVVVVGAAGYASGLFSYDTPSRDGALPDEVRASVPDPSTGEASPSTEPSTSPASPAPSSSPSPSPTASASASASGSASASASPSPSASSASPTASRSAEPTRSPTAPAEDAPPESGEEGLAPGDGPTLQRGDQGPEVAELQQRLRGMKMYWGDFNGNFNRQVEDAVRQYQWYRGIYTDGVGVYGPDTRRRLESEPRQR